MRGTTATPRRVVEDAISGEQAVAVADLARRVEQLEGGPQDIEWAIAPDPGSPGGWQLLLLQARPMTALPDPLTWAAPGPGVWHRNFRLGEWLPEPMTPLFADWLLPRLEAGYLDEMRDTAGTVVPFPWAAVNGWYFNSPPRPNPRLLAQVLVGSRGRVVPVLYNAIFRVSRDPVAADRALLGRLEDTWRQVELPRYQQLVDASRAALPGASRADLEQIVDRIGAAAGRQLWFLAIGGGSAWKTEAALGRFLTDHLPHLLGEGQPIPDGPQTLLRPLPGPPIRPGGHAVFSIDWYWPTAGETTTLPQPELTAPPELVRRRDRAEDACRTALTGTRSLPKFEALLAVARRYARAREEQAATLTLGWPVLRACVDCRPTRS